MQPGPHNESYACEMDLSESYTTHELSLYMRLLVDCEFGMHVVLSIVTG